MSGLADINHIVVLCLENRSFDHMLGFLYQKEQNKLPGGGTFQGLPGGASNKDASGKAIGAFPITAATPDAYFMPGADPGEGYHATCSQLFGALHAPTPPVATNSGFVTDFAQTITYDRKSKRFAQPDAQAANIMGCFTPEMLPVLSGLARGFAVCDGWFASAPTETIPNRAFLLAATSQGHLGDNVHNYTCPSIFGALSGKGVTWAIYASTDNTKALLTRGTFADITNATEDHFGDMNAFQAAAEAGTLPAFTFLEPAWGATGNSQHPSGCDVALGEQLIFDVYTSLRKGAWNQTLFVILYDEHGGLYDHVPPPTDAVPPADGTVGDIDDFDFRRFGVRVPAVFVSPLIAPGTVFRAPPGQTPYDHTSLLKTVEKRWGLQPLTFRDAAAPSFENILTGPPRTDDPLKGVVVPKSGKTSPMAGQPTHLEQVQAALASRRPIPGEAPAAVGQVPQLKTAQDHQDFIRAHGVQSKPVRPVTRQGPGHASKVARKPRGGK